MLFVFNEAIIASFLQLVYVFSDRFQLNLEYHDGMMLQIR